MVQKCLVVDAIVDWHMSSQARMASDAPATPVGEAPRREGQEDMFILRDRRNLCWIAVDRVLRHVGRACVQGCLGVGAHADEPECHRR